ncbi:MAG: histidine phosphatase family protein [Candidatus Omnitrophota bacterium]|nr:histidine phosphatase family protein [Candidatus Omnitrophota bacterium]
MATKILLIRHGSTDWNAQQRYCGFLDVELNNKGRLQARRLKKRLSVENVDKVYSSDRLRAIETAKIIFPEDVIHLVEDLKEISFGIFEGLTYKEILKKHPQNYKKWVADPFNTAIPQGESLNIFKKRVLKAFNKVSKEHAGKSIAIVCHGGVTSVLINSVLKANDFWKYVPDSASLSILEKENSKFKLSLFNDIAHLKGIKIDRVRFKEE